MINLRQFLPWGKSYLTYHYLSVTTSQPNDWKDVTWGYFMWLLRHIVTSDSQGIDSLDLYCDLFSVNTVYFSYRLLKSS